MYILIDRENLTMNHKHDDVNVLCDLAWIELQTTFHVIGPCDESVIRGFTELELKMLYRNATGEECVAATRKELITKVLAAIEGFPYSDVDADEVNYQAGSINVGDPLKGNSKYVKGAKRAAQPAQLFAKEPRTTQSGSANHSQPKGTSKAKIWEVADKLWTGAGSPMVKETVLKIRKGIMDELENVYGIKRTSASSELANWHKDRAPY